MFAVEVEGFYKYFEELLPEKHQFDRTGSKDMRLTSVD
jgi:hypothetical protein